MLSMLSFWGDKKEKYAIISLKMKAFGRKEFCITEKRQLRILTSYVKSENTVNS